MNKIILSGNTTKDLEIRSTETTEIATGSIAVSRPFKNAEGNYDADFFNIVIFNPSEYVKSITKGTKILLDGSVRNRTYEDKKTHENKHITEVLVNRIEILRKQESKQDDVKEVEIPQNTTSEYKNEESDIQLTDNDLPF